MSLANSPLPDLYPGNNSRPNPRALLFFLSSQESYRQPLFSTEEVFCGPDTESRNVANRLSALKVPPGSFDVRDVVLALPASQQPEIVIVKADATARNLPRNLGQLKCPKILLVGDTHHLRRPVQALLRYAMEEPFDFVIFDHTRHHAHFFAEAGAKNVHWLPAVDYGFFPRKLVRKPSRPLTFVGQAGRYHPYRSWVLGQVKAAGLPLEVLRGALAETADLYADSQITLNVSLNGDLNLRVFEALAAGGFLLTDELPEHSGLPLLFKADKHLATWRTPEELIEKIRYYLAHPAEAQRIRAAGQAEILRAHHPEVKLREFYDLVFSGKVNPVYDLSRDHRCARSLGKAALSPLTDNDPIIAAYEAVQELHRVSRQVTVFCSAPADLSRLADLPRLYFRPLADLCGFEPAAESTVPKAEAVIWAENISASVLANHLLTFAGHVIAPNCSAAVVETLELCGYSPIETGSVLFRLARPLQALQRAWDANEREYVRGRLASVLPTLPDSNDCLTLAHLADQLEERTLKRAAIEQAISLDRCNQAALICSAADLLDDEDAAAALLRLEEAARIAPLTPEVEQLRAGLFAELGQHGSLAPYYRMIGRTPVPPAERPRRILVVTNLFPPQELGGYGRKIWEFSNGLIKRGHHLKVLTGDARYLQKTPDAGEPDLELLVERNLVLQGEWKNGLVHKPGGVNFIRCTAQDNKRKVMVAVAAFKPDFVLLGNLDFLGVDMLKAIIAEKIPVLHSLGNQTPAYGPHESIESPLYRIAPASDWLGENLLKQGYKVPKLSTIYPGARLDRFFKVFLPDIRRLRIVFAGLVMPFKGAHILMAALHLLKQSGIEFEADFAGDSTDEDYVRKLKEFAQNNGLTAEVRFNGFLDRGGLTALFARCNVLVFPTQVPEAFGISQVEAMASGLIVITSGTGGTQEVIRHEIDGLVFEMGNAVSLANNLAKLATDKELRNKLQIGAQKRAMQFSVTDSIVRIENISEEILNYKSPISADSENHKKKKKELKQGHPDLNKKHFKIMKSKLQYSLVDFGAVINGDSFYNRLLASALDVKMEYCADHGSADILVIGPYGSDKFNYTKQKTKAWRIFMTGENNRPNYKFYDCSLTFDRFENEGRNFRLPGWMYELSWFDGLPSTFTPEETEWIINKNRPLQKYLDNYESRERKIIAVFNTLEHYRVEAFKAFSKLGIAEGVGRPFGNEQNWAGGFYRGKCELISKYLVNLCFENAIYPGYYTEKLIHSRAMGCLPLVYSDSYLSLDFNPDALVNLYNFSSQSEFIEYVRFLLLRPELIRQKIDSDIFTKKPSLEGAKGFLLNKYHEFNSI